MTLDPRYTPAIIENDLAVPVHDPSGGLSTDTAVVTDVAGTRNAFLRGLIKIFADVWDSVNHGLKLGVAENHIGALGGHTVNISVSFNRPADTNSYVLGDAVGNSTTLGSMSIMVFSLARVAAGSFLINRIRFRKSTQTLTDASFRLHLWDSNVTPGAADNVALNTGTAASALPGSANYLGSVDIAGDKVHSDGVSGQSLPGLGILIKLSSGTNIYGLLEARAPYTPGSSEVFAFIIEGAQD